MNDRSIFIHLSGNSGPLHERRENQDLRMDLMSAVDDVTSAMATVVTELTKTRHEDESSTSGTLMEYRFKEDDKEDEVDEGVWNDDDESKNTRVKMKVTNKNPISSANTQVSVY